MDLIGYLGNALLYRTHDVGELHRRVYAEVRTWPNAKALMGESGHPEQDVSRKARADHSGNFAEFLPCFAIRPAYNTMLFLLSPLGISRGSPPFSGVVLFHCRTAIYWYCHDGDVGNYYSCGSDSVACAGGY